MARKECPNPREECPYYDRKPPPELRDTQRIGCYSDKDHVVPRRYKHMPGVPQLVIEYINDPINHEQPCRWEHDAKTAAGDVPLPPLEVMRERLNEVRLQRLMGEAS